MIFYLKNSEIDRDKWDACVKFSPGAMAYALSWYLDTMSPGWDALVEDDYLAVFPLPGDKKLGFNYIATPLFLQQLGVFCPDGCKDDRASGFISGIPAFYRLIDLCISNDPKVQGFKTVPRSNYELSLRESYDALWFGYSSDCRRNINNSHRYQQDISYDVTPKEVITLFKSNIGRKAGRIRDIHYQRLESLMELCLNRGYGKIAGVRSPKGKLLWCMFIIDSCNRITLLVTVGSRKSREMRTGYHVVDQIIRENAGSDKVLDFAGSSVPSIAVFMKSFGSIRKGYHRIYRNTLPWPIRYLK